MITHENAQYRPGELRVSKLRFYSIGIVAANKALSSTVIEVTPIEELPMLDGEIDSNTTTETATGIDSSGAHYSSSVTMGNSIQAEWLRLGSSNRMTPPDVRRGESVIIYQFADADKYYWNTLKNDSQLRKLETVVYAFSGTPDNADSPLNESNAYYLEISTHTKHVTFHTSQANGEPYGYDIQINTDLGFLVFQDTIGNQFTLDSRSHTFRMQNTEGSFVDMTKNILTMSTADQINLNTKDYTLTSSTSTTNSPTTTFNTTTTSVNATTTTIASTTTNITGETASISATSGSMSMGSCAITASGPLSLSSPNLSLS